jgi:hypothetical protein
VIGYRYKKITVHYVFLSFSDGRKALLGNALQDDYKKLSFFSPPNTTRLQRGGEVKKFRTGAQ